jgi:hypothetical protein
VSLENLCEKHINVSKVMVKCKILLEDENFDQTWKCFTKIWYDIGILLFFLFGVSEQSKTSQPNEKNILSIKVFLHTKGPPKQKNCHKKIK